MQQYRTATVLIILAVIVLAGFAFFQSGFLDERAAKTVVTEFGKKLQNVPLAGEMDVATAAIQSEYAHYVTPELLDIWLQNRGRAPGRDTSSPWPDHIEIVSITEQGAGYVVSGNVIMMTSVEETGGGVAGIVPIVMFVTKTDDGWKIAAYEEPKTAGE